MAILRQEEENSGQQTQQQGDNQQGVSTGSGGSRISSFSSGTQAPQQSSGRFTNIKKYVDANRGAGEQLGNRITSGLEKETVKATDQSQAQQIAQNVQAERDRIGQGNTFNNRLKNDEARQIYGNEGEKTEFSNLLNQRNELSNLGEAKTKAEQDQIAAIQKAQGNVNNLGTESGRFQLLQNTVRNPNYSTGQQRLDQLVLQAGNPQQLVDAQRNLGQQIKTSSGQLQDMYGNIGTNLQTGSTEANEVANLLKNTLGTQTDNLVTAQEDKRIAANDLATKQNAALERILSGNPLAGDYEAIGPNMLSDAGLKAGMRTYNTLTGDNWKNYYQAGDNQLTKQDVISADDFARYEALRGLAEQGLTDFTQAGGNYNTTGLKGDLSSDIIQQRADLENLLNNVQRYTANQSGGSFNSSDWAEANLLSVLKQLENPNITQGYYNGPKDQINLNSITEGNYINGKQGYDGAALLLDPNGSSNILGNQGYATNSGYNTATTNALQALLNDLNAKGNAAGYGNALGGTLIKDSGYKGK